MIDNPAELIDNDSEMIDNESNLIDNFPKGLVFKIFNKPAAVMFDYSGFLYFQQLPNIIFG